MTTILHISDLHRSPRQPLGNSDLLANILRDIERASYEDPAIEHPIAAAVSGDIVQGLRVGDQGYPTAMEQQYEEATEFLVELTDRLFGGDRSRVVIAPGNHDVDWNIAYQSMNVVETDKDILTLLEDPQSLFRWNWKTRELFKIEDVGLYTSRFDQYRNFVRDFYKDVNVGHKFDHERDWNAFELKELGITMVTFNSCHMNDCFNRGGAIPTDLISEAYLALNGAINEDNLLVGIWHHDTSGPPQRSDYMDRSVLAQLADKGWRLCLHGHAHRPDALPFTLHTYEDQAMAVVAAGSLCAGVDQLPPGNLRQYNLISIDKTTNMGNVHIREADPDGIFGPGRILGRTRSSHVQISWSSYKHKGIVDVTRSQDDLERLASIEELIHRGDPQLALEELGTSDFGEYGRRLTVDALVKAERWEDAFSRSDPHHSAIEYVAYVESGIRLHKWTELDSLMQEDPVSMPVDNPLIEELSRRIVAEKASSNE